MKKLLGTKNAVIAILSAAIVGMVVWMDMSAGDSSEPAESSVESTVTVSSQLSPNGKYLIESYGRRTSITMGGMDPAEGIRIRDVDTGQVTWTMEPGYYEQQYEWSPDSRYVSVYYEAREYGQTRIVDVLENAEIELPKLEAVRAAWGEGTTVNELRPDFYAQGKEWLGQDKLRVVVRWAGEDDAWFEGAYTFDIVLGAIQDLTRTGPAAGEEAAEPERSDAIAAMDKLVAAINSGDAAALQVLLQATDPEYYRDRLSIEQAEEAIDKIKFELDLGTISYEQDRGDSLYGPTPVYKLIGTRDGTAAAIREPIILPTVGAQLGYRWAYFSYLVYADEYMAEYLRMIQAGDAARLADFLVVDDLDVPDETAGKLIAMYRLFFGSTEDLKIQYVGPFRYAVYKGNGRESHPVSVIYGDGLMGIEDTFMPSIQ
jgi:hypothetical protein